MKRFVVFLVLLVIFSVMLAGCSGKSSSSTPKITSTPSVTPTLAIEKTSDDLQFEEIFRNDKSLFLPALIKAEDARFDPIIAKEIEKEIAPQYLPNSQKVSLMKNLNAYKSQAQTLSSAEADAMAAIRFYARASEYAAKKNYAACNDRVKEADAKKESAESKFNSIVLY